MRKELDRQIIKKEDTALKGELISKGYNVHRKSKSTCVMVLWGDEFTTEELEAIDAENKASWEAKVAERKAEELRFAEAKKEARKASNSELTIANLWKRFNRKKNAHINLKRDSFYFEVNGKKVRVSDHESYHFTIESERSAFSRAASFDAPDFDFVIEEMAGMTAIEAKEYIINKIK